MTQALIASPGPDSAQFAPVSSPPMTVLTDWSKTTAALPTAVTPPPAALPAPGRSWIETQIATIQDALATGQSAYTQGQTQARQLRTQLESIDILGGLDQTLTDVHRAGQLQQLLPLVVLAIGVVMGKPVLGVAAAAVVWWAGRDK